MEGISLGLWIKKPGTEFWLNVGGKKRSSAPLSLSYTTSAHTHNILHSIAFGYITGTMALTSAFALEH